MSSDWTDASAWSTNPDYPNASQYDARITAAGAPYTVTISTLVTVGTVTLASPDATLRLNAGQLHGATVSPGDDGTLSLGNGTLVYFSIGGKPGVIGVDVGFR